MKTATTTTTGHMKKKASGSAPLKIGTSARADVSAAAVQQCDATRLVNAKRKKLERGGDWRSGTLARVRAIIMQALPAPHQIIEEVKWRKPSNSMAGIPVWSNSPAAGGGIICTGETYKDKVKLTFARGASLPDPSGLFNSSLEGNTRRAIDLHEGDKLNEKALKALVRAAVAMNMEATGRGRKAGGQTGGRGARCPKIEEGW